MAAERQTRSKPGVVRVLGMFALLVLLIAAAIVFGLLPRLSRQRQFLAEAKSDGERPPAVVVSAVKFAPSRSDVELPGNLLAMNEAPIFARVEGYIKARYCDIGQRIKKGAPMVDLDTPELDQQIRQAEASLAQGKAAILQLEAAIRQAKANANLARITADRVKKLTGEGVLSKQELDDREAQLEAREADVAAAEANLAAGRNNVASADANLQRLRELKAFAHIVSPFDGYITYRSPDVGSLITAGNSNSRSEMFRVADIDTMRVFVSVPQALVPEIQSTTGTKAEVIAEQLPGRKFIGDVRRSNAALDPSSRTMLTVLYVPNSDAALLPGMFVNVRFHVREQFRLLEVPGDTVVSRSDGRYVYVADAAGKVHFRKIQPGRDLGTMLEVYDGVKEGDLVVQNPTDEIRDGLQVTLRNVKK